MLFPLTIDFEKPIEFLQGFALLSRSYHSPVYLYRLTTAMTDYMAYRGNSALQKAYSTAELRWKQHRLQSGTSIDQFDSEEDRLFADYAAAAADALRSVVTHLDRGLCLLKALPNTFKEGIEKFARKCTVPENLMDRDWVVSQLRRIEAELDPKYSWSGSGQICNQFQNGACSFGDRCRYQHITRTNQPSNPDPKPADQPKSVQTKPTDQVEITCHLQISPDCERVFHESPSFWASKLDAQGKPYSVPKSCKPCLKLRRERASAGDTGNAALMTAFEFALEPPDFDDEAYAMQLSEAHSMTMSDALNGLDNV
jgi:hypothetical protein